MTASNTHPVEFNISIQFRIPESYSFIQRLCSFGFYLLASAKCLSFISLHKKKFINMTVLKNAQCCPFSPEEPWSGSHLHFNGFKNKAKQLRHDILLIPQIKAVN